MKTNPIMIFAAATLLPLTAFAQPPPPPPPSPNPSGQPIPPPNETPQDKRAKVSVTFLGVETSPVPSVVCEQLGLPKGFGLVVDYVVPDGPAAASGVQQSDILKNLNDQILTEPEQLRKLVHSFAEGTNVTLTLLRKGTETKVTVKLGKKEVPARFGGWPEFEKRFDENIGRLDHPMEGPVFNQNLIREAVEQARAQAVRAKDEALRAAREIQIRTTGDNGVLRTAKIDLGRAQIVLSDEKGELKIESLDGRKILTAKDAQGRLLFSGPVDTADEINKLPAEVRARFERLEQKDFPARQPSPPRIVPAASADDAINQISLPCRICGARTVSI